MTSDKKVSMEWKYYNIQAKSYHSSLHSIVFSTVCIYVSEEEPIGGSTGYTLMIPPANYFCEALVNYTISPIQVIF